MSNYHVLLPPETNNAILNIKQWDDLQTNYKKIAILPKDRTIFEKEEEFNIPEGQTVRIEDIIDQYPDINLNMDDLFNLELVFKQWAHDNGYEKVCTCTKREYILNEQITNANTKLRNYRFDASEKFIPYQKILTSKVEQILDLYNNDIRPKLKLFRSKNGYTKKEKKRTIHECTITTGFMSNQKLTIEIINLDPGESIYQSFEILVYKQDKPSYILLQIETKSFSDWIWRYHGRNIRITEHLETPINLILTVMDSFIETNSIKPDFKTSNKKKLISEKEINHAANMDYL